MSMVRTFLAAVDPRIASTLREDALETALAAHIANARATWPQIALDLDEFVRHLATRLDGADPVPVDDLRASDLYLALACARGNAAAIAEFETYLFGEITRAGAMARASADLVDETKAHLRRVLFVGDAGRAPATQDYTGRGDLRGWVRISALRHLLRLQGRAKREVPLGDDVLVEALSPADDPELGYIRDLYRRSFAEAFRRAVAELGQREKSLLRYQLVEGLSIDDIGALHGVHRATAARWLAAARASIAEATRRLLAAELGIADDELDSIIRLVRSRLDISLERLVVE